MDLAKSDSSRVQFVCHVTHSDVDILVEGTVLSCPTNVLGIGPKPCRRTSNHVHNLCRLFLLTQSSTDRLPRPRFIGGPISLSVFTRMCPKVTAVVGQLVPDVTHSDVDVLVEGKYLYNAP